MTTAKEFLQDAQERPTKQKPLETKCILIRILFEASSIAVFICLYSVAVNAMPPRIIYAYSVPSTIPDDVILFS